MKHGMRLFFLALSATIFLGVSAPQGAEAVVSNSSLLDMGRKLNGNTFFIQELDQRGKVQRGYHAYFMDDGTLAIKFSRKHWKYERWQVDDKGTLCLTTVARRLGKTTLYTSKCGRFVTSGEGSLRWYNGDGQHRANFRLWGKGDKLPGDGLAKAPDAAVVLAKYQAVASSKKALKKEIRPRPFKRRK